MMTLLLVSGAGACGALARYGVTFWGNRLFFDTYLPLPTLVINVTAAFLLGLAAGHFPTGDLTFQLISGLLGGFSTFSTFTNEFAGLLHRFPKVAVSYLLLSAVLGLAAAGIGFWLGG
ncbi:fluoride efflux transporter FluC [Levilactobacillus zymae]|uniref:Fluoride-specific ion channel FluC n=1 Tax=Levilactobacillus zymae TaxID=267363 RepID=A0A1Y6JWG8_9LACO|nr:CrcB family protein [Levilactobacillus zymae]SMS13471.1 CrcB protein [Levilactobacillus zymae]